jgi:poly-gamma-glutamate capsule biosynthesis protein CapA/YwtB (metallophosphatase superfamily)
MWDFSAVMKSTAPRKIAPRQGRSEHDAPPRSYIDPTSCGRTIKHSEISLFLAGDALITRPWSHVRENRFLELVSEIRTAGVAIANLETVIHEFKGYAQADSGGDYMASPPQIAAELKWAGFDMLAHANNHAFDYGTSGVLETIEHVEKAGLILAGSGKDLQNARAPRYFCCNGRTVALVAMTSAFVSYGKASRSRPDLHGRPGVNPLRVTQERPLPLLAPIAKPLRGIVRLMGLKRATLEKVFSRFGLRFHRDGHVETADRQANLDAIAEAASNADVVVASIHAHSQGAWLAKFARQAIERGACVVFVHGPHQVRGTELHRGKPIFYSMGNFVYEPEYITRLPPEAYENLGLPPDATLRDLRTASAKLTTGVTGLLRERETFEGCVALISISGRKVMRIRLIPIDLQFDSEGESRGRPQLASPELGERIVERVALQSRNYGTQIRYDRKANCGEVVLDCDRFDVASISATNG